MATKTVKRTIEEEVITCDADGCGRAGSHIPFNIGGKTFDLCESHKAQISRPRKVVVVKSNAQTIRKWAEANKIKVNAKGRVNPEVVAKWEAAGSPKVDA